MPHTPFTRFLACVLVVLVALALLWPGDDAAQWAGIVAGGVVILMMLFTWSTVKGTPFLDDRAFHRCLPPGANRAFLRTIRLHLWVLTGVALAVCIYCWIWNFSWRSVIWGTVMLALPAWALMAAVGVASSAGSSRQHVKWIPWIAVLVTPLVSLALLHGSDQRGWLRSGRYVLEGLNLTVAAPMVLTAALLYPLIWWLIAARGYRTLGLVFATATGALMPCLLEHGGFVKLPWELLYSGPILTADAAMYRVEISRKPYPLDGSAEPWIPVEDLIDVKGLAEDEHARVSMTVKLGKRTVFDSESGQMVDVMDGEHLAAYELIESGPYRGDARRINAIVSNQGGKIVWGDGALNQSIRKLLPPVESFEHWGRWRTGGPPVVRDPGAEHSRNGDPASNTNSRSSGSDYYSHDLDPITFRKQPLAVWMSNPGRWKLLGSFPATEGADFRLKEGGKIKVLPLFQKPLGDDSITVRRYTEDFWRTSGWSWSGIVLVAIDETGKHAYLINDFETGNSQRVMLGMYEVNVFNMEMAKTLDQRVAGAPVDWKLTETLRKARLYAFTMEAPGLSHSVELPGTE